MDLPLELDFDGAAVLRVSEAARHLSVFMAAITDYCIAELAGVAHYLGGLPLLGLGHNIRFHRSSHWDPIRGGELVNC